MDVVIPFLPRGLGEEHSGAVMVEAARALALVPVSRIVFALLERVVPFSIQPLTIAGALVEEVIPFFGQALVRVCAKKVRDFVFFPAPEMAYAWKGADLVSVVQ